MNRCSLTILLASFLVLRAATVGQTGATEFRYPPAHSFSAICLPDDWQKSVVTNTGALGFDFGPGPYARPLTEISVGVKDRDLAITRQFFSDPRIPVCTSLLAGVGETVTAEAFASIPAELPPPAPRTRFRVRGTEIERIGGMTGCLAWAAPPDSVDPAFRNVAWGTNRPIQYRVRVEPGSSHTVALGLCEPYKQQRGARVLELRVEGAERQTLDVLQEGRKNTPSVRLFDARDEDRDGWISIESHTALTCPDPNTILNVLWMFPARSSIDTAALIAGRLNARAEVYWDCGRESVLQGGGVRRDIIHARFTGGEGGPPVVRVRTLRRLLPEASGHALRWEGEVFVSTVPAPEKILPTAGGWELAFTPGTRECAVLVTHGAGTVRPLRTLDDVRREKKEAEEYWTRQRLPFGRITIPEPAIQYLLDVNIRNMYQIRERIDGVPTFQPGPSVYRGLWMHDAVWHTAAATMLGDTKSAREAIDGLLRYQEPDGRIRLSAPYPMNRETPLVIHAVWRHARLTRDSLWLRGHWTEIRKGIAWLWKLRASTLGDPNGLAYGLFPPGFSDGGLSGIHPEYGSVYWALIGYRSAIDGARWLKEKADADLWQRQSAELEGSFRRAAARDQRHDRFGNLYLPMMVGDTSTTRPPQQANWGIIEAQAYVHLFDESDSLLTGTLAMLNGDTREGLALGTGWLTDGLWPFFSMIEGIAHLAQRDHGFRTLLPAIVDHASWAGTWIEEQQPREFGTRTGGDASNASASSLFIQLLRSMLLFERDSTIDLLSGVPKEWIHPGSLIEFKGLPTAFGPCSLRAEVSPSGREAELRIESPGEEGGAGSPVLFLGPFREQGFRLPGGEELPAQMPLKWGGRTDLRLSR